MHTTASLAQIDTGPGWIATGIAVLIGVAILAVMAYRADAKLTRDIDRTLDAPTYPHPECSHVGCGDEPTTAIAGWRLCEGHAERFSA